MEEETLTLEEFTRRFKARMILRCGDRTHFDADEDGPGQSIAAYAEQTAEAYFEMDTDRMNGPEESADNDMSYWGE